MNASSKTTLSPKLYPMEWLAIIFSVLFIFSCTREIENEKPLITANKTNMQELLVPVQFSYSTVRPFSFRLFALNPDGTPFSEPEFKVAPIQILSANPRIAGSNPEVLAQGVLNEQSEFVGQILIPANLQKLYIAPNYPGLIDLLEVNVNQGHYQKNLVVTQGYTGGVSGEADLVSGRTGSSATAAFTYMGSYNSSTGRPNYLTSQNGLIPAGLLANISKTLPEGVAIPNSNKAYLIRNKETNLMLRDSAEVFVTFIHEGAGYRNALGYYSYRSNNAPASIADIQAHYIIFPNASYSGSGGDLQTGNRVRVGVFPGNTTLSWFVVSDGFNNGTVSNRRWMVYGNPAFNPGPDDKKQHMVLLKDDQNELLVMGFEDILRINGGDQDFNDCIFYATANPFSSVITDNVAPIEVFKDRDGDGVEDDSDDYPDDRERAKNNWSLSGTLMYEDLWPGVGDYDFNDLVTNYRYNVITNGSNRVKEVRAVYSFKAIGASFSNGFGFQFSGVNASQVQSVMGGRFSPNATITKNANGTELGNQKATILVTDNCKLFATVRSTGFFNTRPSDPRVSFSTDTIKVVFTNSVSQAELGGMPYKPFIFANGVRGREIHLADLAPTTLMNTSLFGSSQDDSNPGGGRYFKTKRNLPWAIHIPASIPWPIEKTPISEAYPNFGNWAESGGILFTDWYTNKQGNRISGKLY